MLLSGLIGKVIFMHGHYKHKATALHASDVKTERETSQSLVTSSSMHSVTPEWNVFPMILMRASLRQVMPAGEPKSPMHCERALFSCDL